MKDVFDNEGCESVRCSYDVNFIGIAFQWLFCQCDGNQISDIIKTKMSFNISQNIIIQTLTEKSPKFPKSGSKMSLATQADCYLETDITARKISKQQKGRFIDMITNENINMKEASKIVGMSYSTAKKVFSRFRKNLQIRNSNRVAKVSNRLVCDYIDVSTNTLKSVKMVTLISTIAGREQMRAQRQ